MPRFYSNIPVNENELDIDSECEEIEEVEESGEFRILHNVMKQTNPMSELLKEKIVNKYK